MPATWPKDVARKADTAPWMSRALLALWLLSSPVLCLIYLKVEPSPDQAQFDYMAFMATKGMAYYRDSFDMNWPGAMLLHEAAVRLFGPTAWSWHLLDFCLAQGAAIASAVFLRRAGFRLAPFLALALYPALYVTAGAWMAGQRDIIAMGVLIVACAAMLAPRRREARAMVVAGALVACAVLIRPTYLSVLAGLMILEALPEGSFRPPRRQRLVLRLTALAGGFAAVIAGILVWALWVGNLQDWYQQSVVFTTQAYYSTPPQDLTRTLQTTFLQSWHWMTLGAATGLACWLRRARGVEYPLILLIGLGCAILLSFYVQNKGFGYHLGGFIPLLTMLTAVALDQLFTWSRSPDRPLSGWLATGAAAILALLVLIGTAAKLSSYAELLADLRHNGVAPVTGNFGIPAADQERMIEMIRTGSQTDDRVAGYGTAYQIPYLAQRLPPHRFITPAIEEMTPEFPLYSTWLAEIREGLHAHPPAFVLITGAEVSPSGEVALSDGRPALAELVAFMGTDYLPRITGSYGALFQRKSP